jgi:hypothetical protein
MEIEIGSIMVMVLELATNSPLNKSIHLHSKTQSTPNMSNYSNPEQFQQDTKHSTKAMIATNFPLNHSIPLH